MNNRTKAMVKFECDGIAIYVVIIPGTITFGKDENGSGFYKWYAGPGKSELNAMVKTMRQNSYRKGKKKPSRRQIKTQACKIMRVGTSRALMIDLPGNIVK